MEKKKRVSTLDPDPHVVRDNRVRNRARFVFMFFIALIFVGLVAATVRLFMLQAERGFSLLDPGLAGPVGLLLALVLTAFFIRRGVRKTYFYIEKGVVHRHPGFLACTMGGAKHVNMPISDVTSVHFLESPWSNHLVLFKSEKDEMISVPLFLNSPSFYEELANGLNPELREKAADLFLDRTDESLLMRKKGCWALLSRYNWSRVSGRKPGKDLLLDIWRSDRRLLDYSALLSLLDILLPVLSGCDEFLCDAFRLGLALRIRPLVEDVPAALKRTGGGFIPLEEWLELRKGPPLVRPSLPMVGARRYRFGNDKKSLLIGVSDVLPLLYVAAVCRRIGFASTRILFLYDVWGGKHEIASDNVSEPLDDFAVKLMTFAPHVLEIHEERGWSLGSRFRHRNLKKLLKEAG